MSIHPIVDEPKWITEPMLHAIHAQQIERFGGSHGILDKNVVFSALARPINKWGYDDDADFALLAAAYLVGFAQSQGFNDGNKRTGLACALVFLAMNERGIAPPGEELYALMMGVANSEIDEPTVAQYFRRYLSG